MVFHSLYSLMYYVCMRMCVCVSVFWIFKYFLFSFNSQPKTRYERWCCSSAYTQNINFLCIKKEERLERTGPGFVFRILNAVFFVFAIYEIWMPHVKLDNRRLVRATTWKWVSIKCSLNRIFIGKDADGKQNKKKKERKIHDENTHWLENTRK